MRGKPGTKAEQRRKDAMREIGCIACILDGKPEGERWERMVEIHHMVQGNKKLGEAFTVPLCEPHHTGYGISWHKNRRIFRETYGQDLDLVAITNQHLRGE
jgi:hypothetical protein